jgi:hypothetical protein
MPLAMILVVCALVAFPSSGATGGVKASHWAQENQPGQDAPQATSPPPPDQPTRPEAAPVESSAPPQSAGQESSQQPATAEPDSTTTTKKPANATQTKKRRRKRKPTAQPGEAPSKTVVHNGSAPDPEVQIAPSLTEEQASHQRQTATQLLASTDANLKKISSRQLNASQQDIVKQIHIYMGQAKAAEDAGDPQRAHNLAFKAHLLSDELLKP